MLSHVEPRGKREAIKFGVIPKRGLFDSSCPRLARLRRAIPGHDAESVSIVATVGVRRSAQIAPNLGAGEGNRTLVCSLGSCRSTIELRPRSQARIANLARRTKRVRAMAGLRGGARQARARRQTHK